MLSTLRVWALYALISLTLVLLGYGWWMQRQNDRLFDQLQQTRDALHQERQASDAAAAALAQAQSAAHAIEERNALLRGKLNDLLATDPAARAWADQPLDPAVGQWLRLDGLSAPSDAAVQPDPGPADAATRRPNQPGAD